MMAPRGSRLRVLAALVLLLCGDMGHASSLGLARKRNYLKSADDFTILVSTVAERPYHAKYPWDGKPLSLPITIGRSRDNTVVIPDVQNLVTVSEENLQLVQEEEGVAARLTKSSPKWDGSAFKDPLIPVFVSLPAFSSMEIDKVLKVQLMPAAEHARATSIWFRIGAFGELRYRIGVSTGVDHPVVFGAGQSVATVGSWRGADIVVPTADLVHLYLFKSESQYYMFAIGATFYKLKQSQSVGLFIGMKILMGRNRVQLTIAPPARAASEYSHVSPAKFGLRIQGENGFSGLINLAPEKPFPWTVGTSRVDNDIYIPSGTAYTDETYFTIEDPYTIHPSEARTPPRQIDRLRSGRLNTLKSSDEHRYSIKRESIQMQFWLEQDPSSDQHAHSSDPNVKPFMLLIKGTECTHDGEIVSDSTISLLDLFEEDARVSVGSDEHASIVCAGLLPTQLEVWRDGATWSYQSFGREVVLEDDGLIRLRHKQLFDFHEFRVQVVDGLKLSATEALTLKCAIGEEVKTYQAASLHHAILPWTIGSDQTDTIVVPNNLNIPAFLANIDFDPRFGYMISDDVDSTDAVYIPMSTSGLVVEAGEDYARTISIGNTRMVLTRQPSSLTMHIVSEPIAFLREDDAPQSKQTGLRKVIHQASEVVKSALHRHEEQQPVKTIHLHDKDARSLSGRLVGFGNDDIALSDETLSAEHMVVQLDAETRQWRIKAKAGRVWVPKPKHAIVPSFSLRFYNVQCDVQLRVD
eukprot:GILK01001730.1.p1 GENE.GILK01001730.1~~GILK01001730.1.p1  ORF type:complete len:750 (-),score=98.08 GILK01001730.1:188-2437(-)